jgi:hypothetical protein
LVLWVSAVPFKHAVAGDPAITGGGEGAWMEILWQREMEDVTREFFSFVKTRQIWTPDA